jgi:hypothetical protein
MNLTQTAYITKRILFAFALIFITTGVVQFLYPIGVNLYKSLVPEERPFIITYGKLPQPEFIQRKANITGTIKYELNTPTGSFPQFPDRITIYPINPINFSFSAQKEAQRHAFSLGFTENNLISNLKRRTLQWKEVEITGAELTINTETNQLTLNTDLREFQSIFKRGTINRTLAETRARELIADLRRSYSTATSFTKIYLGKIVGNNIEESDGLIDAQFAEVNFYRTIGEYNIYGPDPDKGLIQVYVGEPMAITTSTGRNTSNLLPFYATPKLDINRYNFEPISNSEYPLLPVNLAWQAVTEQKGVISSIIPDNSSRFEPYPTQDVQNIIINTVELAYYEDENPAEFLQPIYIFKGNYTGRNSSKGQITIYYPALNPNYFIVEE